MTNIPPAPPQVFPLQQGDHLTRDEFERRYDAMPDLKKAELIDGVVHMASPVRWDQHATQHFDAITWLGLYRLVTFGVEGGDNGSLRLDLDNEPQPDAALIILPLYGGRAIIGTDGFIRGAPELVLEIAASTASIDRNSKLRLYQRNGVQEYIIWLVLQNRIEWYSLQAGQYQLLPTHPDGVVRSEVFPGLWLDPQALARRDMARVAAVQQLGLAGPEHAAFVQRLQQGARP